MPTERRDKIMHEYIDLYKKIETAHSSCMDSELLSRKRC